MKSSYASAIAKCPYATKCVGYCGGPMCLNFHWKDCVEFHILKECDKTLKILEEKKNELGIERNGI